MAGKHFDLNELGIDASEFDEAVRVLMADGNVVILDPEIPSKHKVFSLGPDVTLPLASKSTLFALLNIRYLWEMTARTKTEGQSLVVMATFPVPSVKLP